MTDGNTERQDPRARWNRRYAAGHGADRAARFLTDRADLVPVSGRALDVAGGIGRNARWLAERGLEVTLVDASDVAVDRARSTAEVHDLAITAIRATVTPTTVPEGPFDLILVHHYLDVEVWSVLPDRLAPGGLLMICQPTVLNLERSERPPRRWLLEDGDAARFAAGVTRRRPEVTVVELSEGWTADGRHEAHLVMRRAFEQP